MTEVKGAERIDAVKVEEQPTVADAPGAEQAKGDDTPVKQEPSRKRPGVDTGQLMRDFRQGIFDAGHNDITLAAGYQVYKGGPRDPRNTKGMEYTREVNEPQSKLEAPDLAPLAVAHALRDRVVAEGDAEYLDQRPKGSNATLGELVSAAVKTGDSEATERIADFLGTGDLDNVNAQLAKGTEGLQDALASTQLKRTDSGLSVVTSPEDVMRITAAAHARPAGAESDGGVSSRIASGLKKRQQQPKHLGRHVDSDRASLVGISGKSESGDPYAVGVMTNKETRGQIGMVVMPESHKKAGDKAAEAAVQNFGHIVAKALKVDKPEETQAS